MVEFTCLGRRHTEKAGYRKWRFINTCICECVPLCSTLPPNPTEPSQLIPVRQTQLPQLTTPIAKHSLRSGTVFPCIVRCVVLSHIEYGGQFQNKQITKCDPIVYNYTNLHKQIQYPSKLCAPQTTKPLKKCSPMAEFQFKCLHMSKNENPRLIWSTQSQIYAIPCWLPLVAPTCSPHGHAILQGVVLQKHTSQANLDKRRRHFSKLNRKRTKQWTHA